MATLETMIDKEIGARKNQEQKVMDFLLSHRDSVLDLSVSQIAKGADVSSSTVVRFCKSLGYEGLKDFKLNFQAELVKADQLARPFTWESSEKEICTLMETKSVHAVQDLFTKSNMKAIDRIARAVVLARNIEILGVGGSAIIAEYLFRELLRYGKKVSLLTDPYMMRHNISDSAHNDVCIAVSRSGSTPEILNTAGKAKSQGMRLFCLTSDGDSPLAAMSEEHVLSCNVRGFKDEGDAFSRLSQFAAVNMITLLTAIYLGRDNEEYKRNFNESSNYQNFISGDKDVH